MTFGRMIDRMDRDLRKNGTLNTEIQDAILSAIAEYQENRFWFLEGKQTASTVADQTTYGLDAEQLEIDVFTITVSGNEYPLISRTFDWYREVNTNPDTVTGIPTDYAYHNEQYYLYPTPNAVFTLTWYGQKILATLSATTDTNDWMSHSAGERLIRFRAMYYVWANTLQDPERAAEWGGEDEDGVVVGLEAGALRSLQRKTAQKVATNRLQPEAF